MKRKEIEKKTDEIIAFSGIEKYIDTPIKKYSSGMSVRLAFSVSAHLDTDILLVDEVLSVGDADFRKQSLEKMKNIVQDGRTIIFVSHNMNSIRELCEEVFWIEKGNLKMTGPVNQVITNYLQLGSTTEGSISWEQGYLNESSSGFDVFGVEVLDENKQVSSTIEHARDFDIVLEWVLSDNSKYQIMYRLLSPGGSTVVQAQYEIEPDSAEKDQRQKLYSRWNSSVASPGLYQLSIKVKREGTDIIHLDKVMSLAFSDEHMGLPEQNGDLINLDWRIE